MALFSQPPKSLCILRLSAIGDVCHALALVQHIQAYWPETKITWIIGKTESALMSGLEGVELVPYDKKTGWRGIWALWKFLKNNQFDALLNMQTAFRASILSLGIQAKYKLGFGKIRSREGQAWFVNQRINDPRSPHVLDGFMAFADYLGVPPAAPHWQLPLSDEDRQYAAQFIDSSRKNLVISPCSSKAEKDWTPEGYAAIANWAHQQQIQVILCASNAPKERAMVDKILQLCDFAPINAAGKTNLKQLAALIGMADGVLSPDSGPAHIATVMRTPVVGLYAYHNPLRTAPYLNQQNVVSVYEENIQKEYAKASADLPWVTKPKAKNLMAQIQVDAVIAQLKKLGLG